MKKDKNFILGVGCQKGGTTWLHRQIGRSKYVDMGFCKEYHVFDALHVKACEKFFARTADQAKKCIYKNAKLSKEHGKLFTQLSFYSDIDNYFDYLWYRGEDITTTGDMTPSYAALPPHVLRLIKDGLESRGFKVRVIFLMRDPVGRCLSMAKMNAKVRSQNRPELLPISVQENLRRLYRTSDCKIRTKYELTIKNLESVFSIDNIYYGFYESLFDSDKLNDMRDFLNLSDFAPDANEKVGVSDKTGEELSEEIAKEVFHFYRDTYIFCDRRFGVKALWDGWKYS